MLLFLTQREPLCVEERVCVTAPSENSLIYFAETNDHAILFLSKQNFDLYSLYIMNPFVVYMM